MKNELSLLVFDKDGKSTLVCEDGEIKTYRSEGQANSDGRRMINAGDAVRYKILKTVADHI